MITDYFGVPILTFDFEGETLNQIQAEVAQAIPEVKKLDLSNPWDDTMQTSFKFGSGNNVLDAYNLTVLKQHIFEIVNDAYVGDNYFISESWINFSQKGNFQFDHAHGNAALSGVYYYQTSGQDGNLKFKNPNVYEFLGLGPKPHRKWIFCEPRVGRLVIFPAYLEHRVDPNLTDSERISLTVNMNTGGIAQLGEQ